MNNIVTISLSGTEKQVDFIGSNAWIRNDTTANIYVSKSSGVKAGSNGVISIPAGQSAPVFGAYGRIFATGTGSVQLIGSDYSTNPFKTSAQSGGSGADEIARAAIETHSKNSDVHVSAEEKDAWNSKAEISDIPSSLPANGGNADTLGGMGASDFAQSKVLKSLDDINNIHLESGIYSVEGVSMKFSDSLTSKYYVLIVNQQRADNGYGTQIGIPFSSGIQRGVFYRIANASEFTEWKNIGDGCNAKTIDAHPIYELVLKSEYDELASRVSELETLLSPGNTKAA